jgi:hypothetical protein
MVQEMVPPEKLLIMDLKEGWAPLCKFLDLPIPDEPLPKANDANAAADAADDIALRIFQIWSMGIGVAAIASFSAWRLWNMK